MTQKQPNRCCYNNAINVILWFHVGHKHRSPGWKSWFVGWTLCLSCSHPYHYSYPAAAPCQSGGALIIYIHSHTDGTAIWGSVSHPRTLLHAAQRSRGLNRRSSNWRATALPTQPLIYDFTQSTVPQLSPFHRLNPKMISLLSHLERNLC